MSRIMIGRDVTAEATRAKVEQLSEFCIGQMKMARVGDHPATVESVRSWFSDAVLVNQQSYGHGAIHFQKEFEIRERAGWVGR